MLTLFQKIKFKNQWDKIAHVCISLIASEAEYFQLASIFNRHFGFIFYELFYYILCLLLVFCLFQKLFIPKDMNTVAIFESGCFFAINYLGNIAKKNTEILWMLKLSISSHTVSDFVKFEKDFSICKTIHLRFYSIFDFFFCLKF